MIYPLRRSSFSQTSWAFGNEFWTEAAPLCITVVEPAQLSKPKLLADGRFQFTINGSVGREYMVEAATQASGPWTRLETVTLAAPTQTLTDGETLRRCFFRVSSQ